MEDDLREESLPPAGGGPCLFLSMPFLYGPVRVGSEPSAVLPSAVCGRSSLRLRILLLLILLACSTTSIALCLFVLRAFLASRSPEGLLCSGDGCLASCRNSTISLVSLRFILRDSRGFMPAVNGRGGTVLDRRDLSRSMRSGETGVGRGSSYLRSIGTGCASNSTGPFVLIGALGRGLSTDIALLL
jgi:hypothetical protein